ncbi:unnamed protein product [Arabis nemorensis]|uniref:Gnk2-homologous domain-containing protein n=1 Tax=Arabis nemorensis TaxID=586526 RepID=A0A565BBJ3_9BRAS|nr:unnamed protein product [Arabis nemorensis]
MCTSYSLSKHLVFVHILALQLFTRRVSSLNLTNAYLHHKCLVSEGKYQPGSKFEKNLDKIIEIISTNKFQQDDQIFKSYGKAPNLVTIIFQCRGDSYGSKCLSCFATAVAGVMLLKHY